MDELITISRTITQLRASKSLTVEKLIEECGSIVTFERLQQLKRPENRGKFEGTLSNKTMRRWLAAKLLPHGKWNQNQIVYANIDIPEDEVSEYNISEQEKEGIPREPLSISLFTPEMYKADKDYYMEESDPILKAVYAPYCYRFTLGRCGESKNQDSVGREERYCSFEELCARVKEVNGDKNRWFRAQLFKTEEEAKNAGMGEPLRGEVEFICGSTSIENAYLCISSGEVPPEVTGFYERSTDSFSDSIPNATGSNGPATPPPSNGGAAPVPSGKSRYQIKLYNIGQGNCIYLRPKRAGIQKKFFFDVGATCYPNDQKANETRGEVRAAYANIGASYPDFVILSHWHRDHYNLIYKFNNLVTCPWIVPDFSVKFPMSSTSMLNVLKKNNLLHLFGSAAADQLIQRSGIMDCVKASGPDCNSSGLLVEMEQTLLPGDCEYRHWPSGFATGKTFQYMVVPHHGAHIHKNGKSKASQSSIPTALDQAAEVYVCVGENIYRHPADDHMNALDHYLGGGSQPSTWTQNPKIHSTKTSCQPCFTWDDI